MYGIKSWLVPDFIVIKEFFFGQSFDFAKGMEFI